LGDILSDEARELALAMVFAVANAQMVNPELLCSSPEWVYFAECANSILDQFPVPASIPLTSGLPALQDIG
jgi:hypothetical protein